MILFRKKLLLIFMCAFVSATTFMSTSAYAYTHSEKEEIDVFKLAEKGTPKELEAALQAGANFNVKHSIYDFEDYTKENIDDWLYSNNETPLHRAAAYNHNPESIKFLIEQGLDVNAIASEGNYAFESPLACALSYQNNVAAKVLLDAKADPNAWTEGGYNFVGTPCHIVAFEYRGASSAAAAREAIAAIVKAGGSVNGHEELSPEQLKQLREEDAEFAKHGTIFLPRHQWTNDEPFQNMRANFSHWGMGTALTTFTPLMLAVIYDEADVVNILLDFGADVNIRSVENKSAVDYAKELPKQSKIRKTPRVFKRLLQSDDKSM